jgi:hypothetical protein
MILIGEKNFQNTSTPFQKKFPKKGGFSQKRAKKGPFLGLF